MNEKLIEMYFAGQCSDKELIKILDWFHTEEGRSYLKEHIHKDWCQLMEYQDLFLYPDIASDEIFKRIQQSKQSSLR